jgi:enoyl-CoA hydratase/carnithine racemase
MPTILPSPTPKLVVTLDDAVATVAIDNPAKRNALDLEMWSAFPAIMAALAADERVRVVVIRGAGSGAFASGADISEFETVRADAAGGRRYEAENEAAFWAVARCSKPVISMIRGFCLGGGVGLALAYDLRIAEAGATFGIPAARLGVGYPPGAMSLVVAALGAAAAKDLFFTARRIGAAEAQALGMVQRVVAENALESTILDLARGVAANAPLTLKAAKAAIDRAAGLAEPNAPDPKALADACFDSADYREGRLAFLQKRQPVFTGR